MTKTYTTRIGYACPVCEAHRSSQEDDTHFISWIHCSPCWAARPPVPDAYIADCVDCGKEIWGHPDRGFIHEVCNDRGEQDDRKCHESDNGKHHDRSNT